MEPIKLHMPKEMFSPAAYAHYEEDASLDILKCGPDLYDFKEPLHWQADITNTGGALLVTGTVEGVATGTCARCLDAVDVVLTGEIEGYYLTSPEEAAPEDLEDDEFDYLPADKAIDMAPLIESALLLELPSVLLCRDDCKGICPRCGADLNEGPCACETSVEGQGAAAGAAGTAGAVGAAGAAGGGPASRPGTNNPFAALKDLIDFE